ncbi:hypothetical protein [Streptomyces sp. NPDC058964]|uniref:hypothetical protein n=1 Tax=Streptomyces sp. NPDC058964 TaxID=3346681 RepID=UPI00369A856F
MRQYDAGLVTPVHVLIEANGDPVSLGETGDNEEPAAAVLYELLGDIKLLRIGQ